MTSINTTGFNILNNTAATTTNGSVVCDTLTIQAGGIYLSGGLSIGKQVRFVNSTISIDYGKAFQFTRPTATLGLNGILTMSGTTFRLYNLGGGARIVFLPTNTLAIVGNLTTKAVTKSSGSFVIPHPDPVKRDQGFKLKHCFVESPTTGDNLYRYTVHVKEGCAKVSLPMYVSEINHNLQFLCNPVDHFGSAYATLNTLDTLKVSGDDGPYYILVIGSRKDPLALEGWGDKQDEYIC